MDGARTSVWAIPLAIVVAAAITVPILALEPEGWPRYRRLRDELDVVQQDNTRLLGEVRTLDREVHGLRTDLRAIEKVARDDLGMIRADEIVVQFPE